MCLLPMPKILLIEDDPRILTPLKRALELEMHRVDVATDGEMGWNFLQQGDYDVLILDVMLPKLDGLHLCHRLRQQGYSLPVLMLTARDTTLDKVRGLDSGADDYLVKPFELDELHARLRSLLRRNDTQRQPQLHHGALTLDPSTKMVTIAERIVDLTPKEYKLLEHFLSHPTQTFSREQLVERIWGWEDSPESDVVRAHIKGLRHKLRAMGMPDPITTVRGFGYRLSTHV